MVSGFANLALMYHHYSVHSLNRRQSVRNHQRSASSHDLRNSFRDVTFSLGVNRAGCFIQYKDRTIKSKGSGKTDQLLLPCRKVCTSFKKFRLIAVCQLPDESVQTGLLRSHSYLFFRNRLISHLDVRSNIAEKNEYVLRHDRKSGTQVLNA